MNSDSDLGTAHGFVKWYSTTKGFGFIVIDDSREVFFHYTGVVKDNLEQIREGAEVTCKLWKLSGEAVKGNGLKATSVRVVA